MKYSVYFKIYFSKMKKKKILEVLSVCYCAELESKITLKKRDSLLKANIEQFNLVFCQKNNQEKYPMGSTDHAAVLQKIGS